MYVLLLDDRDIGIGVLGLKGHSPTLDGVSTRFESVPLINLVGMRDCKSVTFGCDGRVDHRGRGVIDVIKNPEEEPSCQFVVPGECGGTRLGSVHENEREVTWGYIQTADGDPIRTLVEQVRRICDALLGAIRRPRSFRHELHNRFHFDPRDRLPLR